MVKGGLVMTRITSLKELDRLRDEILQRRSQEEERGMAFVTVGMGTCSIAVGALKVFQALKHEIETHHLDNVILTQTGCIGLCTLEPILEVTVGTAPKVSYGHVQPQMVGRIVQEHLLEGKVVDEFVVDTTPFPTI
jgi:NADP-reducing hydrogenase subunit HndB